MLQDLDETIRQLLFGPGGLDAAQVELSFKLPNREWSEKLGTRPVLNCYLFDLHERRLLREEGWALEGRGTRQSARRQPPLFFEVTYLITAWTQEVEDQHFILWNALETLMDHPVLPRELLHGSLSEHPWPIHTSVAQQEGVLKSPGEFWAALDNQLKPSLSYSVILGRERRATPTDAPPVRAGGLRLFLPEPGPGGRFRLGEIFAVPVGASVADVAVTARPLDPETTAVGEVVARATSDADGGFSMALAPGRYRLEAAFGDQPRRRTVAIPGAERAAAQRYSDVLRDQAGRPLPNVLIEVEGLDVSAVSAKDGAFSLDLPPGRYVLRLQIDGWVERRRIAVHDSGFTRLTLEYGGVPTEPT